MRISEQLITSYVECESLHDLLEIMEDNGLLSKKGKIVSSDIWEKTEKNKGNFDDPMEKSWSSLSAHHKNFMINEAKKGGLNKRARDFVLTKIPDMEEAYNLSLYGRKNKPNSNQ